jgi:hypothetical protein
MVLADRPTLAEVPLADLSLECPAIGQDLESDQFRKEIAKTCHFLRKSRSIRRVGVDPSPGAFWSSSPGKSRLSGGDVMGFRVGE